MKQGDRVRVIGIPPNAQDDAKLQTRALFEMCLGKIFVIAGIDHVEGLQHEMLRLDVGHIVGKEPYMETIWLEPQYVQAESGE